jgi:hypothetical protein
VWRRRRIAIVVGALLAACAVPRAPDLLGAPEPLLESELVEDGGAGRPAPLRRSLFVFNHSKETVGIFVDGRHIGWLGPRSSAAFHVGRGAGTKAELRATCSRGEWRAQVEGPVWEVSWHLR